MRIKFLLVSEGPSERHLVPILETLCVRAGAEEAMGDAPDLSRLPQRIGRCIESQVQAALQLGGFCNLLFVHKDADSRNHLGVQTSIVAKLASVVNCPRSICIIPVQELEAWLMTNEQLIREVVGNARGRNHLGLPTIKQIEKTSSPKELLKQALMQASGEKGRRLRRIANDFPHYRALLLQRLLLDGPINQLPAWQRLTNDIKQAVHQLSNKKKKSASA